MTANRHPHGCHLRTGRRSEVGRPYLPTFATCQRRPVFSDYALGRVVIEAARHHATNGRVESFALVVMPDHVHWLMALAEGMTLAKLMASVKGYSSRTIRRMVQDRFDAAPLWQEGYYDHAPRQDEDLRKAARYVLVNPLRAGLVERLAEYPLWECQWPEEFVDMHL